MTVPPGGQFVRVWLGGQVMATQVLQQALPLISVRRPLGPPELVTTKVSVFHPGTKPEVMFTGCQLVKAVPTGSVLPVGAPFSQRPPELSAVQRPVSTAWFVEHRKKRLV